MLSRRGFFRSLAAGAAAIVSGAFSFASIKSRAPKVVRATDWEPFHISVDGRTHVLSRPLVIDWPGTIIDGNLDCDGFISAMGRRCAEIENEALRRAFMA